MAKVGRADTPQFVITMSEDEAGALYTLLNSTVASKDNPLVDIPTLLSNAGLSEVNYWMKARTQGEDNVSFFVRKEGR